jgi:hypothetical protein
MVSVLPTATGQQGLTTLRRNRAIGIDIGKDVFHIVGFDQSGKIILGRKINRLALIEAFEKLPPCIAA